MPPSETESARAAEIVGSLCLATDLGMGFPFQHGLQATLMAVRLCELLGVEDETTAQTYYVSMLIYAGCTTDAEEGSEIFAGEQTANTIPVLFGSPLERAAGVIRSLPPPGANPLVRTVEVARRLPRAIGASAAHQTALCEVADMLAMRLGLPPEIHGQFKFLTERWDGRGILGRAKGDDIPMATRIALLARDAAFQNQIGGRDHAARTIQERAGGAFDPDVARSFVNEADLVLSAADSGADAWEALLDSEPNPHLMLEGHAIDRALGAIGDFADLIHSSLSGHSAAVAKLSQKAAEISGMGEAQKRLVRRAALIHDVGRVAVDPRIWAKKGPLSVDEREKIRLHPYHTERIFDRSGFLQQAAAIAGKHHERMNGSGYHRGVGPQELSDPARLLGAADTFHAMTEPRPFRQPLMRDEAADELTRLGSSGRLDPKMVEAVIEAAGEPAREVDRPAALTPREAEVLGLIARGLQTKQVARRLDISKKTTDTHIQAAYRKIGVSTRAAATLYAMEHGLVPPGVPAGR